MGQRGLRKKIFFFVNRLNIFANCFSLSPILFLMVDQNVCKNVWVCLQFFLISHAAKKSTQCFTKNILGLLERVPKKFQSLFVLPKSLTFL